MGEMLYFSLPLAEDILPYETVADIELENFRQRALRALLWQVFSHGGWQTELLL